MEGNFYHFFLDLAIILIATKLFGMLTRKVHLPQVVGALTAGLLMGPSVFGIVHESDFIMKAAELGVVVLLFMAGLETDTKELKKTGAASLVVACFGVMVPFAGGYVLMAGFHNWDFFPKDTNILAQYLFVGTILCATSVGITVEALREMGKLNSKVGNVVLGAAIIDDVIGIIVLTIVIGFKNGNSNIGSVLLNIGAFFLAALIFGKIFNMAFKRMSSEYGRKRRLPIYAFVLCLLFSYAAQQFFQVADITGAYVAGVILSTTMMKEYIDEKMNIMSYMLLGPIFFASIGLKVSLAGFDATLLWFSVALVIIAIVTKIVGCGIGAKICKFGRAASVQIGVGMVARGEVALVVLNQAINSKAMDSKYIIPFIITIVITSLAVPILLPMAYRLKNKNGDDSDNIEAPMETQEAATT